MHAIDRKRAQCAGAKSAALGENKLATPEQLTLFRDVCCMKTAEKVGYPPAYG